MKDLLEMKESGNTQLPEKKKFPRCNCSLSQKNTVIKCNEITKPEREEIFKYFWKLSWKEKKIFVKLLVDEEQTKKHQKQKE